ncbi:MAG: hypothetical protein H7Y05_04680 [Steroidobacteraceae bacterium]|nr:hypothetical protein [Deltaproteobacteria bacterium]
MSIRFRYIVKFALLSVVIAAAGCSWPSVKIGDDKYLLAPPPTKADDKGYNTPESTREKK